MKKIMIAFLSILVLSSCEKILFEENQESQDPFDNFEYLWNQCDQKYSYFDVKQLHWEAIRSVYEAKLYDGMSDDSLFNVLGAMLDELKDDHSNLISSFNISRFGTQFIGQDNFDWRIVQDNYIGQDYYISGPFMHNFVAGGEIAYVRFPAFTGRISSTNIDFITNRYKDTKGMIIDIRENGGGAASDIFSLLSRFVNEEETLYYSRIKSGPGHNEFANPEPAKVSPEGIYYGKRVAILTDRSTYSAGSFTSLSAKALDNFIQIGDTTGGGLGLPNGGQLPNGWDYRFSITQALTLDYRPDYENGVPPDMTVLFDWNDLTTDEIIEAAIDELMK